MNLDCIIQIHGDRFLDFREDAAETDSCFPHPELAFSCACFFRQEPPRPGRARPRRLYRSSVRVVYLGRRIVYGRASEKPNEEQKHGRGWQHTELDTTQGPVVIELPA